MCTSRFVASCKFPFKEKSNFNPALTSVLYGMSLVLIQMLSGDSQLLLLTSGFVVHQGSAPTSFASSVLLTSLYCQLLH